MNDYQLVNGDSTEGVLAIRPGLNMDQFADRQQRYVRIGWRLTAASMIGQSIFGMLLIDRQYMKDSHLTARVCVDLLMLITAFEGKRRLVQFFSQDNFKTIADDDFFKKLSRAICTPSGVINSCFTLNASFVFGGLSNLGFDGAANLLLEFDSDTTTVMAGILRSAWLQYPIASTALICNLFSFPKIHQSACSELINLPSKLNLRCVEAAQDDKNERVKKVVRLKKYLIDNGVE